MKKSLYCLIVLLVFNSCAKKSKPVEKIIENGVEVVLNQLEPQSIKNVPAFFSLEEELTIDFERNDLAELGIAEVIGFAVDSKGNVYCHTDSEIFKFDSAGNFQLKFGTKGEGPGEFGYPGISWVNDSDEFVLYEWIKFKFLFFDDQGQFLKEIKLPPEIQPSSENGAVHLNNVGYLYKEVIFDREAEKIQHYLNVLDEEFNKITQLKEHLESENPFKSARINLFRASIKFQNSSTFIYAYCQQNPDYEINVYDLQGNLIRKIKKEYQKVNIPQAYKDEQMENYLNSTPYRVHKMEGYFPDYYPPIKNFHIDTEGRIFVETYEDGEMSETKIVDIIHPDGVFIGRTSLKAAQSRKFKNGYLYSLYEKESGFQELVVSNITWK